MKMNVFLSRCVLLNRHVVSGSYNYYCCDLGELLDNYLTNRPWGSQDS